MDAETAAHNWSQTWERAWPLKDIDAITALYSEKATYRSLPFRQPHIGVSGARAYLVQAFTDENAIECWFGEPMVREQRAAVEWWAVYTSENKDWTIVGTTVLRFAPDGKVDEHCDYWSMTEGRHVPAAQWGR